MRVVVVGGGVGGLACAQRLAKRDGDIEVQLVDRALRHDFAPSFLWLLTGERSPERVSRSLAPLGRAGVTLTEADVTQIDVTAGKLATSAGEVGFDELVLAAGAALAPDSVPGLSDAAHGFYTRDDAARLRDALAGFGGGRVLVVVAAMPFKCPAAPDIATAEPQPMPVAGEQIGAQVVQMLAQRRIGFTPGRTLQSVDGDRREARFADGNEPYDLLIAIPPHRAPDVVASSALAGPQGWIPVDAGTLRAGDCVHAIGDVTAIKLPNGMLLPKAGVFAHAQGEAVADNLAAAAAGRAAGARFDGHGACFLETGGGRAGYASGDFYAAPAPAVRMRAPARRWHWAKVLFERRWLARLR